MNKLVIRFATVAVLSVGAFQAIAAAPPAPSATTQDADAKGTPSIPVPTPTCPQGWGCKTRN